LLKGGLILDATAARILSERGFDDMIGCHPKGSVKEFGAEECVNTEYFGKYAGTYIPLKGVSLQAVENLAPSSGSVEISRIVNHDREKIASGVLLFENRLGGKIAVLPYVITAMDGDLRHFICYQRQFMFRHVFEWMNPESVPVFVEDPSDFAVQCWNDGNRMTCCLTNLSYDDVGYIIIKFNNVAMAVADASFIADDGNVEPLSLLAEDLSSEGETRWRIRKPFHIFTPFIIMIKGDL